MKNTLLLALANIKRRKLQSILTSISIGLAILLFITALGILSGIQKPFDIVFDRLNASHILLYFDQRVMDEKTMNEWITQQEEVQTVNAANAMVSIDRPLIFKEREIKTILQLTERHDQNLIQDKVSIFKGKQQAHPLINEIWIPNHLADNHGIAVGDTLGIPTANGLYSMKVGAIVIDPHFASGLMNPTRAWVAPGALPMFNPSTALHQKVMGVRLNSPTQIEGFWLRFNQEFSFEGNSLQYGLFKSVFLSFYSIMGGLLVVFALLAIFVSLLVISTTLSGNILSDYQKNGILNALGFTTGNLRSIYLYQYLLLFLAALPFSLLSAYLVVHSILDALVDSIGLVNADFPFWQTALLTSFLFSLFLALFIYFKSRQTKNAKPVIAIRYGTPITTIYQPNTLEQIHQGRLPLLWSLGLRQLMSNKKRSIYTGSSLILAIFLLIFSCNVSNSFSNMGKEKALWGFEDADLQVQLNKQIAIPLRHQDFIKMIKTNPAVQHVSTYSYQMAMSPATKNKAPLDIVGKIYAGDLDEIGLTTLEGVHPTNESEIALCFQTAIDLHKTVGDVVELFIEGQFASFEVTSIYQDVSNLGKGFRLPVSAMQKFNPLYTPTYYALQLKENIAVESFKIQLQKDFAETIVIALSAEERQEVRSIIGSIKGVLISLCIFFLLVLMVVLFNDTIVNIQEKRTAFGIFKSIGATPWQLKKILIYKQLILAFIALCITIPIALWISPLLISSLTKGIGLIHFPFIPYPFTLLFIIPGILFFVSIIAHWATGRLDKIQPRILMG